MIIDATNAQFTIGELIFSTISTVMYTRSLIPKSCFSDRVCNMSDGKSVKIKGLLEGSHERADSMISKIRHMYSLFCNAEIRFIKLAIVGTIKVPAKGTQYVQEIYNIDLDYLLMSVKEDLRSKIVEDNTISVDGAGEQLFATVYKILRVAESFEPLETMETYCEIYGPLDSVNPQVYDQTMFAPYDRYSKELRNKGVLPGVTSRHIDDGTLNEIEDLDLGTVNSFYYSARVWVRRILSESPIISEPPTISEVSIFATSPSESCECDMPKDFQFATTKCKLCSRLVHLCCYAISEKSKPHATCYSCKFAAKEGAPPKLMDLMRIRFLWRYYAQYDLPKSLDAASLFPAYVDAPLLLNTMIRHSILEISENIPCSVRGENKLKGKTGYIKIASAGLQKENGTPLLVGAKYYFLFSPLLDHWKVTGLKYKKQTQLLFFPNTVDRSMRALEQRCDKIFGTS